jgi:hypothetical protein
MDFLTIEDGTNRLSQNIYIVYGINHCMLRNILEEGKSQNESCLKPVGLTNYSVSF